MAEVAAPWGLDDLSLTGRALLDGVLPVLRAQRERLLRLPVLPEADHLLDVVAVSTRLHSMRGYPASVTFGPDRSVPTPSAISKSRRTDVLLDERSRVSKGIPEVATDSSAIHRVLMNATAHAMIAQSPMASGGVAEDAFAAAE